MESGDCKDLLNLFTWFDGLGKHPILVSVLATCKKRNESFMETVKGGVEVAVYFRNLSSYVIRELDRMKVVKMEVEGKPYLFRTEGSKEANQVFKALHMRPPTRVRELEE